MKMSTQAKELSAKMETALKTDQKKVTDMRARFAKTKVCGTILSSNRSMLIS